MGVLERPLLVGKQEDPQRKDPTSFVVLMYPTPPSELPPQALDLDQQQASPCWVLTHTQV